MGGVDDYISLTDIARYKNSDHTDDLIRNWLRNRNTLEFLGLWELLNNPDFNPVEFDGIRMQDVLTGDNGIPFDEKMSTLTTKLAEQFARGSEMEKSIRENLKGSGYEF